MSIAYSVLSNSKGKVSSYLTPSLSTLLNGSNVSILFIRFSFKRPRFFDRCSFTTVVKNLILHDEFTVRNY